MRLGNQESEKNKNGIVKNTFEVFEKKKISNNEGH